MKRLLCILSLLILAVPASFGQDSTAVQKRGIYSGFSFGTWFPDGHNKALGSPFILGLTLDFKFEKNAFGLAFDLIGWPDYRTPQPIDVKSGDSVLTVRNYFGANFTLDYARELWSMERFIFEAICGIGYGRLSYYNPDRYTEIGKSSFIVNPGISARYLIGSKVFLRLKVQYCLANYDMGDPVSTNLQGNYLTTKLIVGMH